MEADWEFEVGGAAPIIEAHWPGFVDLREHPHQARELTEARQLPGLADALALLNATSSPVWTSKTDVFDPGSLDTDELDATREEAQHVIACYVDLLMRSDQQWSCQLQAERYCRALCERLRSVQLRCCRVDLVVRRALIELERYDLGATAYLTACGRSDGAARACLAECLEAFTAAIVRALQ
jgi:hypothetical protein